MQKKDLPITPPNTITMSLIELIEHLVWMLWNTPCYSFSIMSDKVIVWRKAFAMNNDNRHIPEDAYFRNLHLLPHYVWGAGAETNTFNQSINHLRVWTTNSQKFIKCFLTAIMGVGIYLSTFTKTFFFFFHFCFGRRNAPTGNDLCHVSAFIQDKYFIMYYSTSAAQLSWLFTVIHTHSLCQCHYWIDG